MNPRLKPILLRRRPAPRTVTFGSNSTDTFQGTRDCSLKLLTPTTNSNDGLIEFNLYAIGTHGTGLLAFTGLSSLPAGSIVSAASLTLVCTGSGTDTNGLYKCLRPWVETTATWNTYDGSNNWTSGGALGAGTDTITAVSDTQSSASPSALPVVWSSAQLALDVQSMLGGAANNGWLIRRDDGGADDGNYKFCVSSTGADGSRPSLSVTYTPPY